VTPQATTTPTSCVYQEQSGSVVIEAEAYSSTTTALGAAWQLETNVSGASGAGAMQNVPNSGQNTQNSTNGPALNYQIAFSTPGTYYVALRGYGPSTADDSVFIGVNTAQISQLGLGSSLRWFEKIGSTDVSVSIPSAGTYTFTIWMREDGAIIDRLWLTTNQNAVVNSSLSPNPDSSPCAAGVESIATNTAVPTATFTAAPSATVTPFPTMTFTPFPTDTPVPTATNTDVPTVTPFPTSTSTPTDVPVEVLPSETPTPEG
jgi:hypothetical protein